MINIKNMTLVLKNTIYKEMRSKVLLFLFILTVSFIIVAHVLLNLLSAEVLSQMGSNALGNSFLGFFFHFIMVWNFFLCVYLGVTTVRSDLENDVAPQLLSFPIKRIEYLIARILGVWVVVNGFFIACLIFAVFVFDKGGSSFSGDSLILGLLQAGLINSVSLLATTALSVFFSLNVGKLGSLVSTMILVSFIHASNSYFAENALSSVFDPFHIAKALAAFIHIFLPHLGSLSTLTSQQLIDSATQLSLLNQLSHFVGSFCFLIFITGVIFRRKEV